MNESQTTIGGRTISVGYLPALQAVKVEVALARLCGDAIFKAIGKKGGNAEEIGAAAISAITAKLDSDEVIELIKTIYSCVRIDGQAQPLDQAFTGGRTKELWQVMFFALRYNFSDFLPASLFKQIADKVQPTLNQLNSQTSAGTSGGQ